MTAAAPAEAEADAPAANAPVLTARGLRIGHGGRALLPAFDVTLAAGEIVLVVGRNGSGKSTFIKTVLGLVPPVGGQVVRRPGLRPAFVPQATTIDPFVPLRARDVVELGRQRGWSFLRPWTTRADRAAAERALAAMELADVARHRFAELSGGQQQRVLIARVLASGADLLALDEPTAAMDAASERTAYQHLRGLARAHGLCLLIVTHAVAVAAPYADRIAFFDPDDRAAGAAGERGPDERGRVAIGPSAALIADLRFEQVFGRIDLGEAAP